MQAFGFPVLEKAVPPQLAGELRSLVMISFLIACDLHECTYAYIHLFFSFFSLVRLHFCVVEAPLTSLPPKLHKGSRLGVWGWRGDQNSCLLKPQALPRYVLKPYTQTVGALLCRGLLLSAGVVSPQRIHARVLKPKPPTSNHEQT